MRIVSARREERLCSLSFPESTTFFRFAKVFRGDRQSFSQGARSVYAPLCFRSQQLFPFRETFVSPWSQSFSSIARSFYAPPRSTSQPLICILAKFAATQCVDPVTREKHFKQTHLPCQHKNHFFTDIQAKPRPGLISGAFPAPPKLRAPPTHCQFSSSSQCSPLGTPMATSQPLHGCSESTPKSA